MVGSQSVVKSVSQWLNWANEREKEVFYETLMIRLNVNA